MEIDALRASPAVQAMHPCARSGYIWLLLDAWQTEDCTIPSDPIDLADKSGLGDELWATHGLRILRKFDQIEGSDRLRNQPQYERWTAAKAAYEKRHEAANKTNEQRWASVTDSVTDKTSSVTETLATRSTEQSDSLPSFPLEPLSNPPSRERGTLRERVKQEQKPSRVKSTNAKNGERESNPRHTACKEIIFAYYKSKNDGKDPPWDGREGKALGMLLGADPAMDAKEMRRLLHNRYLSEVVHGDRPGIWINAIHSYANGPLDRYGKLLRTNGSKNATISNGTGNQLVGVLEETLARRQRVRAAGQNGDLPASGQTRSDDTGTIHRVPSQPRFEGFPSGDEESSDF